jgi:hypothetical protein
MSDAPNDEVTFSVVPSPLECDTWELRALYVDGEPVAADRAFGALSNSEQAAESLCEALRSPELPGAVFFEVRPYSASTFSERFEAVLLSAPALLELAEDAAPFSVHMKEAGDASVAMFPTIGNDATLFVPTKRPGFGPYTHLMAFMHNAPNDQRVDLVRWVASAYYSKLSDARNVGVDYPLWLSTAGLGVSYLHVRIDTHPKYYKTARFKQNPIADVND